MFFKLISPYITPVIWIMAVINLLILWLTRIKIKKLDEIVHPQNDRRIGMQAEMSITDSNCAELSKSSDKAALYYTLYANITAIFPLLGIFGTVCSLMGLSGADTVSNSFFIALDTTVWGLIFAMIFKLFDSFVSSKLDRALDEADYLIHSHDEEKRIQYATQTEARYHH